MKKPRPSENFSDGLFSLYIWLKRVFHVYGKICILRVAILDFLIVSSHS
ncbi:hypothetical protein l11_18670 [Neisseria weaveri LMG 5135]|nr:hypothetical protein l11_18670 [Neisseria weaveri LMG 5135]